MVETSILGRPNTEGVVIRIREAPHEGDHAVNPVRYAEIHLIQEEFLRGVSVGTAKHKVPEARDICVRCFVRRRRWRHIAIEFERHASRRFGHPKGFANAEVSLLFRAYIDALNAKFVEMLSGRFKRLVAFHLPGDTLEGRFRSSIDDQVVVAVAAPKKCALPFRFIVHFQADESFIEMGRLLHIRHC